MRWWSGGDGNGEERDVHCDTMPRDEMVVRVRKIAPKDINRKDRSMDSLREM